MTMPDPREFDECAYEGWELAAAENGLRKPEASQPTGDCLADSDWTQGASIIADAPAAASFQCEPCPCGGLCDNCEEGT